MSSLDCIARLFHIPLWVSAAGRLVQVVECASAWPGSRTTKPALSALLALWIGEIAIERKVDVLNERIDA